MKENIESKYARAPKDNRERIVAAVNSSFDDLYPDGNGRVVVTGKNTSGEIIYLGDVSELALYQKTVNPITLINRVRFGNLGWHE